MWKPIKNLSKIERYRDSQELEGLWLIWEAHAEKLRDSEAYIEFLDRMSRQIAIETGVLERLYTIDRGITQLLIERGSVIGCALDAWMIVPNWVRRQSTPEEMGVRIDHLVDHIDRICQLAGDAKHVGVGSDLDGGFGYEQTPIGLHSIAELSRLEGLLTDRGFGDHEVDGILSGNFIRFLRDAWS